MENNGTKDEVGDKLKNKIVLATLAMLPIVTTNVSASGQIGIVTTSSLNVRGGVGTNHSVLFTIKKGEKVEIKETSNGWYKIRTNSGKEGWSSSQHISITSQDTNSESQAGNKKKTTDRVNLRNGAGASYRVITTLNKGEVLEVVSESNGWAKVKYDGRIGYISSQYLENVGSSSNTTTSTSTKVVNIDGLNVRSGPSTSNGIVGKLKKGEKVSVISESNGWSKIKFNSKEAYTSTMYLKEEGQVTVPEKPEVPLQPETSTGTKEVKTTSLNVRSGPGTNYSKIGSLKEGNKVDVISENNGWSRIKFSGKDGFVSSEYLSEERTNTPIPPVVGGDNIEIVDGATIHNKGLSYSLNSHVQKQYNSAKNVIHSSQTRSSNILTTFSIAQTNSYVNADKGDLEYFLNPNNFKNSKKGMLQFLRLDSYKGGITASELNSYLNAQKLSSKGTNVFYNKGQAFIDAAKKYDIDLVYLVSHAMWETGYGSSTLAQGQTLTSYKGKPLSSPVKVYNFFGIGAFDGTANLSGAEAAYANGWTTVEKAIEGSAKWIANNYIKSSTYNQNTIYKMKFNYDNPRHQYATDVNWANGISGVMYKLIGMYDTKSNLKFEIPNYNG